MFNCRRRVGDEGAEHTDVAVREVEDAGGAVEQYQPERHQRVDATHAEATHEHLQQVREAGHSGHDFQKRLIFSQRPYRPAGSSIMMPMTTTPNTSCDQLRKLAR